MVVLTCFRFEKFYQNKADDIRWRFLTFVVFFQSFSENVLYHIFVDKMLKMDCSQLTQAGFRVFERLFLAINERSGKIRINDENTPSVTANDLIGLSNFWDIALDHRDVTVATAAANSLNSIHQNVSFNFTIDY
jgi:hypothetical protein